MNPRNAWWGLLLCAMTLGTVACRAPGYPPPGPEVVRPDETVDFPTLYKKNCSACHGADGKNGAAISLANPVYLAFAGEANLRTMTAKGVPGTLMPPFAKSAGGMLTDQQIESLVQGMLQTWGGPAQSSPAKQSGPTLPPYVSNASGDAAAGQRAFTTFCARCHGADGSGGSASIAGKQTGSLVDPSYLALVSDQSLRSLIIAGQPEEGMPDWQSDMVGAGARPMTDQEITDTVAWLVGHRVKAAGQPYPQHP